MPNAYQNQAAPAPMEASPPPAMAADLMQQMIEEELQNKVEEDQQFAAIAKEIEGLFATDAAQRQRKESEWYWAERLQLGSMFNYWNRWSPENSLDPFSSKDDNYVDGDKPEFNIVKPKIKIGQAQLEMLQFGAGSDKNFNIKAKKPANVQQNLTNQSPLFYPDGQTPIVNPQTGQPMTVGEIAGQKNAIDDEAARKMDEECWSQLSAVKYGEKMRLGFADLLWYGTVIYKGPFNNNKSKKSRYQTQTSDGQPMWVTAYTEEPAPDFERINPWLFYPDHRALTIKEAEHATVVHIYTPTQLSRLSKQEGFRADRIAALMKMKPDGNYYPQFRARAIQYNNSKFLDNKYVCLEWRGTVGKTSLNRLGIEPPYDNPFDMYKAEIWVCQGEVIYAALEMLEADDCLPFAVNVWEPDPASLFGFGSILLRDAQRVVNMTYKMVLDNAGLAAMPQVGIDTDSFKPQDGKPQIRPGQIWRKTENGSGQSVQDAIQFFYVPNNLDMLTQVLNMAREFGEEESIIPLMAGGMGDPQVGDTGATGMAMVMKASTTVLSSKARAWDDNITGPIVGWFYEWNMQYSQKEDIKGDYDVDVQTATAYLDKIMEQRDLERLCLEIAQNPEAQIMLRQDELYRVRLARMNIPYDSIVRSKEEVDVLRQKQAEAAKNAPPDPKAQADLLNAQAHMDSVENDAQQLAFQKDQGMQEAQMQQQKDMATLQTRNNEAQARAIDAQASRDVSYATLASKNAEVEKQLAVQTDLHAKDQQTQQFIAGITAQQTDKKLSLEERNTTARETHVDNQGKKMRQKP